MSGAAIDDTMVAGITNSSINSFVTLRLQGAAFTGITANSSTGTDVSSWFTNLPAGLSARAASLNQSGSNTWYLGISISGIPTETKDAAIEVTIPVANISGGNGGSSLVVPVNNDARFYISGSAVSLSGSIDLKLNGFQYDEGESASYGRYGRLQFYTNPNKNGNSIASAQINQNGMWNASIPSDIPVTIYAFVSMNPMGTESLSVGQRAPSAAGEWSMGTRNFVSISGTLSVTTNGTAFVPDQTQNKYLCVTAAEGTSPNANQIGGGYSIFAVDGAWRIILPSVMGSRTISLRVFVFGPGVNLSKYNVWTGQLNDTEVSGIPLNEVF
jgi:hypothetical protein